MADTLGLVAALLTTAAFLPQVLHTYRTRDVKGLSLPMYVAFTIGVALWMVYGLLIGAWPVILSNAITLALALSILWMRIAYSR